MDGIDFLKNYITRETASQAQLARDVDCSESHLSLILARKSRPSPKLARRISNVTGIRISDLRPDLAEVMREACE